MIGNNRALALLVSHNALLLVVRRLRGCSPQVRAAASELHKVKLAAGGDPIDVVRFCQQDMARVAELRAAVELDLDSLKIHCSKVTPFACLFCATIHHHHVFCFPAGCELKSTSLPPQITATTATNHKPQTTNHKPQTTNHKPLQTTTITHHHRHHHNLPPPHLPDERRARRGYAGAASQHGPHHDV
jgi:hypothetical protein